MIYGNLANYVYRGNVQTNHMRCVWLLLSVLRETMGEGQSQSKQRKQQYPLLFFRPAKGRREIQCKLLVL